MAIRTKARAGESIEQMLRRHKKLCEKEGLTKDVKRQAYYEKPSERRRRAMRKSFKRQQVASGIIPATPRKPMGKSGGPRGGRGGSGGGYGGDR